jgi:pyruvate dehydrogenase E2 component (dihydrolipoamide acetyltransferase)
MPALGADMDEGTIAEWLVKPGDTIRKGDPIAVVDTAKSAIEVESFHTGTVGELLIGEGETVPVGTVLATIAEPAAKPPAAAEAAAVRATPLVRREAGELGVDLARVRGTGHGGTVTRADVERAAAPRPRVSPLARRVAADLGVDLAAVTGTGPGGAIREGDVRAAARTGGRPGAGGPQAPAGTATPAGARPAAAGPSAEAAAAGVAGLDRAAGRRAGAAPAAAGAAGRAERALAMRQAIARLMARSKREIPHYYVSNTVDLGVAMAWLRERNRELEMSQRLVPAALLLKAAALAARQVPQVNGYWLDDHFDQAGHVHLGTAISLRGGGLITPAIHDADQLPLAALMAALRDLVTRARAGRLRRAELTDATLTVTNLGDQGVESVQGVIYPPQVALVGFGKVVERPWAVGGLLGVRPVVFTTLAADHRATDGYTGGRYLAAIDGLLQKPEEL